MKLAKVKFGKRSGWASRFRVRPIVSHIAGWLAVLLFAGLVVELVGWQLKPQLPYRLRVCNEIAGLTPEYLLTPFEQHPARFALQGRITPRYDESLDETLATQTLCIAEPGRPEATYNNTFHFPGSPARIQGVRIQRAYNGNAVLGMLAQYDDRVRVIAKVIDPAGNVVAVSRTELPLGEEHSGAIASLRIMTTATRVKIEDAAKQECVAFTLGLSQQTNDWLRDRRNGYEPDPENLDTWHPSMRQPFGIVLAKMNQPDWSPPVRILPMPSPCFVQFVSANGWSWLAGVSGHTSNGWYTSAENLGNLATELSAAERRMLTLSDSTSAYFIHSVNSSLPRLAVHEGDFPVVAPGTDAEDVDTTIVTNRIRYYGIDAYSKQKYSITGVLAVECPQSARAGVRIYANYLDISQGNKWTIDPPGGQLFELDIKPGVKFFTDEAHLPGLVLNDYTGRIVVIRQQEHYGEFSVLADFTLAGLLAATPEAGAAQEDEELYRFLGRFATVAGSGRNHFVFSTTENRIAVVDASGRLVQLTALAEFGLANHALEGNQQLSNLDPVSPLQPVLLALKSASATTIFELVTNSAYLPWFTGARQAAWLLLAVLFVVGAVLIVRHFRRSYELRALFVLADGINSSDLLSSLGNSRGGELLNAELRKLHRTLRRHGQILLHKYEGDGIKVLMAPPQDPDELAAAVWKTLGEMHIDYDAGELRFRVLLGFCHVDIYPAWFGVADFASWDVGVRCHLEREVSRQFAGQPVMVLDRELYAQLHDPPAEIMWAHIDIELRGPVMHVSVAQPTS